MTAPVTASGRAPGSSGGTSANTPADAPTLLTGAERADPSYIQYLEKQSLLYGSTEAARIVSGSHLAWQNPASPPSADTLLHLAPSWISVNPLSLLTDPRQPVFSALSSPVFGKVLNVANISGLYMAPTGGSGKLWAYDRVGGFDGEDIVQFGFSEAVGGQDDYLRLLNAANGANRLLGMDAVPSATGMGPDFFLAGRNTRGYPGLYCMVEIPREYWSMLPEAPSQWRGEALSDDAVRSLATRGFLPPAILGERLSFPLKKRLEGGWAATAEIRGIDGTARRWVYRYHGAPEYPVLNWEDPSRAARRVLAASIIQSVGLQGGAIIGLDVGALFGLEADNPASSRSAGRAAGEPGLFLEPGLGAARDMGREIRSYGGWSLLHNELPLAAVTRFMDGGPDLIRDSITSPAAEHALLTGDATLLRFMTDEMLIRGIDSRRLAHRMPDENGISYVLPHLADLSSRYPGTDIGERAARLRAEAQFLMRTAVESALYDSPKGRDPYPVARETLYTTSAGLAALALGAGNSEAASRDLVPMMRQGQLLLAFYKAMQPGLFMLSGTDLAGTLPLSWRDAHNSPNAWDVSMTSRGAYSFQENASSLLVTTGGVPRAKTIHPAADVQAADPDSFLSQLGRILGMRQRFDVARGEMHGRFLSNGTGCIAFAVVLPAPGPAPGPAPAMPDTGIPRHHTGTRALFLTDVIRDRAEQLEKGRDVFGGRMRPFAAPGKGFNAGSSALLVVCNFSRDPAVETIDCSASPVLQRMVQAAKPSVVARVGEPREQIKGNAVSVSLGPWQGIALLIGTEASYADTW